MNGNSGITPTVELATTNGNNGFAYPYPVMPMMGGYGNGGFGGYGADFIWIILLLALFGGNGFGGFGGYGGGFGLTDGGLLGYAIGNNATKGDVSDGFNSLHLSNQLESNRDAINNLSTQLCGCCGDISNQISNSTANVTNALTNGFYNAEVSACNRQMAQMNQDFANQLNLQNNLNALNSRFSDCCCENRLGLANLTSTVISENCADREALSNGIRDLISNQNAGTQRILDQLCNDKIDAKNEKIADLQREILMKDLQASQIAQTAQLRADNVASNEALVNLLNTCPIPSTPVFGRTPIFTCNNNGCGCGMSTTSQFI